MGSHFKLLTGFSVDEGRTQHCIDFAAGGQWNGAYDAGACALCCFNNIENRAVEHPLIKRLKADANSFS